MTNDTTRWLDEGEMTTWLALTDTLHLLPHAMDRQLTTDSGIPLAYYLILAKLSEAPDQSMRMGDLARSTSTSQSRLSHATSRLEERGWVARRPCSTDGRGQVASLTTEGFAALKSFAPGHVEESRRLVFDKLSAEQVKSLGEILTVLTDGLHDELARPARKDKDSAEA